MERNQSFGDQGAEVCFPLRLSSFPALVFTNFGPRTGEPLKFRNRLVYDAIERFDTLDHRDRSDPLSSAGLSVGR